MTVWKKVLFDLLVNKVREEIDPDLVGYMVNDASKYRSACTRGLLKSLVERTGNDPVLLVLDGIGAAFDHECNFRFRRERFLDFCESILNSWLMSCDNFNFS